MVDMFQIINSIQTDILISLLYISLVLLALVSIHII
jgi:hypothetical protein